jgi:hypothetical protein
MLGIAAFWTSPTFADQSDARVSAANSAGSKTTVAQAGAPDFGSPPSGEIPILYNDRHVYAKPDTLVKGRVLAAYAKDNTIYVPVRSMFEQMGATVNWDAGSKTMDISKPGSDIKLTVGKPEVVINGESRPLDVPPMVYKGVVVAPVRVISEAMGAYVQWVADKNTVVVRYIPAPVATPPPPPPPPPPPATPAPTPTPTPTPAPTRAYETFIAGDYTLAGKAYDEFSPGNALKSSGRIQGAIEFPLFGLPWMLEGQYQKYSYQHNSGLDGIDPNTGISYAADNAIHDFPYNVTDAGTIPNTNVIPCGPTSQGDQGCVTTIGGHSQTYVPHFQAQNTSFNVNFGLRVLDPRIYIAVSYINVSNNYGYPSLGNVGIGVEKLPDLDKALSWKAYVYYYPYIKGGFNDPLGNGYTLAYRLLKFDVGATYSLGSFPVFIQAGYRSDNYNARNDAPSNRIYGSAYAGLGFKFL